MKYLAGIAVVVVMAVAANCLFSCGGDYISKAHFDKRIEEINARIDSLRADVVKVWNVARETRANTDSIKNEVRGIDGKIDVMQKDINEIKNSTQNIEFKLF